MSNRTTDFHFDAQRGSLVFSDEFDGNSIDSAKWDYDLLPKGIYGGEMQAYTNERKNSWVQDGLLYIDAVQEPGNAEYTSARLVTRNKADWLYGQVEVRAKIPIFEGAWPAIWMLPTDNTYGGWPNSGEIDIMEHVTCQPDELHATVHTAAYNHNIGTQVGSTIYPGEATMHNDWHTYKLRWTPTSIEVGFDDNWYFRFNKEADDYRRWPFKHRFHLILNVAVGGDWGGWCLNGRAPQLPPRGSAANQMIVDWVRVYDNSVAPSPTCTPENVDPYASGGGFVSCCDGVVPCVGPWDPSREWFYLCKRADQCTPPAFIAPNGRTASDNADKLASVEAPAPAPSFAQPALFGVAAAGALLVALVAFVVVRRKRRRSAPAPAGNGSVVGAPDV